MKHSIWATGAYLIQYSTNKSGRYYLIGLPALDGPRPSSAFRPIDILVFTVSLLTFFKVINFP